MLRSTFQIYQHDFCIDYMAAAAAQKLTECVLGILYHYKTIIN